VGASGVSEPTRVSEQCRKVLYVDDEDSNLVSFKYCFAERFEVLLARSGAEALQLLETEPVAVLLSDQRMPHMSGAELCAQVRRRFPEVVRMIVTAYADLHASVEAINSGQVSRYILKPWTEEHMAEELQLGLRTYELGVLLRDSHAKLLRADLKTAEAALLAEGIHELSSPLTSVNGGLQEVEELLKELADSPRPSRARLKAAQEMVRATIITASELTARVQQFRRGDSVLPEPGATTDVIQAVEAALAIVGPQLRRRAHLTLQLGQVPPVAAPATQVCQVIANLLANAVEALEPTPDRANRIVVMTSRRDDRVVVEIEDTGRGLSAEALAQAFEPFVSSKQDDGPHGLGLAVVRKLVRALGGEVTITSAVGRGTAVVVELPIARGQQRPQ
jgi:two-component system, NtrC family, sensor kinase